MQQLLFNLNNNSNSNGINVNINQLSHSSNGVITPFQQTPILINNVNGPRTVINVNCIQTNVNRTVLVPIFPTVTDHQTNSIINGNINVPQYVLFAQQQQQQQQPQNMFTNSNHHANMQQLQQRQHINVQSTAPPSMNSNSNHDINEMNSLLQMLCSLDEKNALKNSTSDGKINHFRPIQNEIKTETEQKIEAPNINRSNYICTKRKIKNYLCDECGKAFQHHHNLQIHKRMHTQQALQCAYCPKQFARKANLMQHIRVHTDDRPWKCKLCTKTFRQKKCLIDHERTHSGVRPFQCEFCPRAFTVKHNLISHRRLHTGHRPFGCTLCPKKFVSKSSLNSHTRRKHPELWSLKKSAASNTTETIAKPK